MRDPQRTTDRFPFSNVQVRVYGDMGVVDADFEFRGTYNGKPISGSGHDIHWYQKRNGRWQQIADYGIPRS